MEYYYHYPERNRFKLKPLVRKKKFYQSTDKQRIKTEGSMSYYRRRGRQYGWRRKFWRRKRGRGRGYAWRKNKLNMAIKSIELKTHDFAIAGANILDTGTIELVSGIAQGNTIATREGNEIIPVRLYGNIQIHGNDVATVPGAVRIIIFQDYEQRGVIPTIGTLLESSAPVSLKNKLYRERYRILYDKKWVVGSNTDEGFPGDKIVDQMNKQWKSKKAKMEFIDTTGVIASMGKASLFIAYVSDAGVNYPTLTARLRLRFFG